jgi:hypothetical protein
MNAGRAHDLRAQPHGDCGAPKRIIGYPVSR